QTDDGIRCGHVTGVQTCALPISGEDFAKLAGSSEDSRANLAKSSPATARSISLLACACFSATTPASAFSGIEMKMWLARTWTLRSEERRVGKVCSGLRRGRSLHI